MANKVFLNKQHIIEITLDDDQTAASMRAVVQKVTDLVEAQHAAGKPVLVFANLLGIGILAPEARKAVVEAGQTLTYNKFALVGSGSILRLGVNLIAQAIGKRSRIKYFEDHNKAVAWLKK